MRNLAYTCERPCSAEHDDSEETNEDSGPESGSAEDPEDQGSGSENESSGSDSSSSSEDQDTSSSDDDDGLSVILKGNGSSTGGPPAHGAPSHSTAQVGIAGRRVRDSLIISSYPAHAVPCCAHVLYRTAPEVWLLKVSFVTDEV